MDQLPYSWNRRGGRGSRGGSGREGSVPRKDGRGRRGGVVGRTRWVGRLGQNVHVNEVTWEAEEERRPWPSTTRADSLLFIGWQGWDWRAVAGTDTQTHTRVVYQLLSALDMSMPAQAGMSVKSNFWPAGTLTVIFSRGFIFPEISCTKENLLLATEWAAANSSKLSLVLLSALWRCTLK